MIKEMRWFNDSCFWGSLRKCVDFVFGNLDVRGAPYVMCRFGGVVRIPGKGVDLESFIKLFV